MGRIRVHTARQALKAIIDGIYRDSFRAWGPAEPKYLLGV